MNAFDIIGPIMIGPSSSHTAGACRIGNYVRSIVNEEPMEATIIFSGSFKSTYKGHGTDKALIAGLMGYKPDDMRLRDSIEIAKKEGRNFNIVTEDIELAHPNTALCKVKKKNGDVIEVQGSSVGGGNIRITKINGVKVYIDGKYDVLIIVHKDIPGMIHKMTKVLWDKNININGLSLSRTEKNSDAVAIVKVDDKIDESVVKELLKIENISDVTLLKALRII